MNRAEATARAIGFAREHIADYVSDAEVTLSTTREQTCPALSAGRVRLVVTLTVVVDDPDAAAEVIPTVPSGDFAIGDDRGGGK